MRMEIIGPSAKSLAWNEGQRSDVVLKATSNIPNIPNHTVFSMDSIYFTY